MSARRLLLAVALLSSLPVRAAPPAAPAAATSDADRARLEGLAAFRAGRYEEARRAFESALAHGDGALLHFNLASACYKLGDFAAAEAEYRRAADSESAGDLAALALLDAGLAADGAGHLDDALLLWRRASLAGLGTPIAVEADRLVAESERARMEGARDDAWVRLRHGRDQLKAGDVVGAIATLTALGDDAERAALPAADRAEIEYALGHALRTAHRLDDARAAFANATRLDPRDPEARFLLGLTLHDLHRDDEARAALRAALDGGLAGDDRSQAEALLAPAPAAPPRPRLTVDTEAAFGYDSNYASGREVVFTRAHGPSASDTGSPEFVLDVEPRLRLLGRPSNGLYLGARVDALVYTAAAADPFSLVEEDLSVDGSLTPVPWLTLGATVEGYFQSAGVAHSGPYQMGLEARARATLWEGEHLATRLRYLHALVDSLDPTYDYHTGQRDQLSVGELAWLGTWRLSLAYSFRNEAVGTQVGAAATILAGDPDSALRCAAAGQTGCDPAAAAQLADPLYAIPWSYQSHAVELAAEGELFAQLHVEASVAYEHRDYGGTITITPDPGSGYHHHRVDDRAIFTLAIRREIVWRLVARADAYLLVNRSTIDNTQPGAPFDFDDKNYPRVVATVGISRAF